MKMLSLYSMGQKFVVLFFLFFSCCFLEAQEDQVVVVKEIDVRYVGSKTVSKERILANISTKVGERFSQEKVDEDIRGLIETGEVENVRALVRDLGEGGIRLIFEVSTRAKLAEIVFQGNARFKDKRLRNKVELNTGEVIRLSQLIEGKAEIETLYRNAGYSDIEVSFSIVEVDRPGFSKVIYKVNEGLQNKVRQIRFEGNTVFTDRELRRQMTIKEKGLLSILTGSGKMDDKTLLDDLDALVEHYQNAGYLKAEIKDYQKVRVDEKRVDIEITLFEGEKYTISEVMLVGVTVFSVEELQPALTLVSGEFYSAARIRQDVKTLRDYYGSRGYAQVRVTPTIERAGGNTLKVTYEVEEGEKVYVGNINIAGNIKTKDNVIRREVTLLPGELFNTLELQATRRRLENMHYFNPPVEVVPRDTMDPQYKDIDITVEEGNTGTLSLGASLSSIDNLVGSLSIEQRNFDIKAWPNFTGAGQRFRLNLRVGEERRNFDLSLTEPWFMGKKLSVGGRLFYEDALFLSDDYEQRRYGGAVNVRKPIDEYSSIRGEYRLQQVEIHDIDANASERIKAEEGEFLQSLFELSYARDTRDSIVLPRSGYYFRLGGKVSGGFLGGDVDTYGVNLRGSKFFLLPFDTILSFIGDVDVVDGWDSGDAVPIFERLFLGGANNLRGFDFRDVGPKDENGEPLGGKTAAYFSAEYTFPIVKRVRGALFYDVGFVNEGSFDFDTDGYNSNWGVGVRIELGGFPLQLDYGIPLEADEFNDSNGEIQIKTSITF